MWRLWENAGSGRIYGREASGELSVDSWGSSSAFLEKDVFFKDSFDDQWFFAF